MMSRVRFGRIVTGNVTPYLDPENGTGYKRVTGYFFEKCHGLLEKCHGEEITH